MHFSAAAEKSWILLDVVMQVIPRLLVEAPQLAKDAPQMKQDESFSTRIPSNFSCSHNFKIPPSKMSLALLLGIPSQVGYLVSQIVV